MIELRTARATNGVTAVTARGGLGAAARRCRDRIYRDTLREEARGRKTCRLSRLADATQRMRAPRPSRLAAQ